LFRSAGRPGARAPAPCPGGDARGAGAGMDPGGTGRGGRHVALRVRRDLPRNGGADPGAVPAGLARAPGAAGAAPRAAAEGGRLGGRLRQRGGAVARVQVARRGLAPGVEAAAGGRGLMPPAATGPRERVLLVHGLWSSPWWLLPLALRLRRLGFEVEGFGYPSIVGGPEPAIAALVERLRAGPPCHLAGHSLGGLVALEALRRAPDLPVRRVVCLGSPLCGSATARLLAARRRLAWLLGRSAPLLLCGCQPWSGRAELGVIAGELPRGVGRLLAAVGTDSDGTV